MYIIKYQGILTNYYLRTTKFFKICIFSPLFQTVIESRRIDFGDSGFNQIDVKQVDLIQEGVPEVGFFIVSSFSPFFSLLFSRLDKKYQKFL